MKGKTRTYVSSLQECSPLSSPFSAHHPALLKLVNAVRAGASKYGSLKSALMDYLTTDRTLVDIADEHSCTIATLAYWGAKLGFPKRKRGRRVLRVPSADDKRVIDLVRQYGAADAARRAAKSRPRIYQILARWAPELKRPWRRRDAGREQPRERHAARSEVIAFRLTQGEWKSLQATMPPSGGSNLSANGKARSIVVGYIASPTGTGRNLTQNPTNPAPKIPNDKIVDFIGRNTA